jgi:hypothetical protein
VIGSIGATRIVKSGAKGQKDEQLPRSARSHTVGGAAKLAVAVWLLGPLPLILTNAAFMKLHRVFVVSYAAEWLVKLTIVAVAAGWFLH